MTFLAGARLTAAALNTATDPPLLFAMVIVTALLGIAVYQALAQCEKWLLSWR